MENNQMLVLCHNNYYGGDNETEAMKWFFSIGNASESILQKFRKSFALRFHKKAGSKEGSEGGEDVMDEQPLGEEESAQLQGTESPPPPLPPPLPPPGKEDATSDSKFK
jgi:hypothetical protein